MDESTKGQTLNLEEVQVSWNPTDQEIVFRSVRGDCPDLRITGEERGKLLTFLNQFIPQPAGSHR